MEYYVGRSEGSGRWTCWRGLPHVTCSHPEEEPEDIRFTKALRNASMGVGAPHRSLKNSMVAVHCGPEVAVAGVVSEVA